MGRWIVALLALGALALGLWLAGRAPGSYFLEEECRRFHDERVRQLTRIRFEEARLEHDRRQGLDVAGGIARLDAERESLLRTPRTLRVRGWEIVLLPPGATSPAPGDFLVAGHFDPSRRGDPAELIGPIEVWIAPRSALARLFRP